MKKPKELSEKLDEYICDVNLDSDLRSLLIKISNYLDELPSEEEILSIIEAHLDDRELANAISKRLRGEA